MPRARAPARAEWRERDPPKTLDREEPAGSPEAGPIHASTPLDPDRAVADARGVRVPSRRPPREPRRSSTPVATAGRSGSSGSSLLIAFSVYEFNKHGVVSRRASRPASGLHYFVAPLATIGPDKPANPTAAVRPRPPESAGAERLRAHAARARVLRHRLWTVQARGRHAAGASRAGSRRRGIAVRRGRDQRRSQAADGQARPLARHWTIPVGVRQSRVRSGRCTASRSARSSRLARRGGVVAERLIGEHWLDQAALAGAGADAAAAG